MSLDKALPLEKQESHPLLDRARKLPTLPGIYMFKDSDGNVLYVGKSVSLRNRVTNYLQPGAQLTRRIGRMVLKARSLEVFVVENEEEALLLEFEFINAHRPRYNVVFRDDKSYPYLKVTNEKFPRILFTRKPHEHEGEILGPYPSALSLRRTLRFMTSLFPVRSCNVPSQKLHTLRACLDYHIKRCQAPCEDKVDSATYNATIQNAVLFLKGKNESLLQDLRQKMEGAASAWEFERASEYKKRIDAIERIHTRQEIASSRPEDMDVHAIATDGKRCVIQTMSVVSGRIAGQTRERVPANKGTVAEILRAYVIRQYIEARSIPQSILLSEDIPDHEVLGAILCRRGGHRVEIIVPSRGRKAQLVRMALKNADLYLSIDTGLDEEDLSGVAELAEALGLSTLPSVIECFDISHLGGQETVASMVVAVQGRMDRSLYRRFKIREVEGIDDFASMREVVGRRYRRLENEDATLPDLILLDGGLGQLSAGKDALRALGLEDLPLIALAKREEVIYGDGFMEGLRLPEGSLAHRLVRRIRDEAHRFAITYHRKLRSKRTITSSLSSIPGVGPTLQKRLLSQFGSARSVGQAQFEDLIAVKGVSRNLAQVILKHLGSSNEA